MTVNLIKLGSKSVFYAQPEASVKDICIHFQAMLVLSTEFVEEAIGSLPRYREETERIEEFVENYHRTVAGYIANNSTQFEWEEFEQYIGWEVSKEERETKSDRSQCVA